MIFGYTKFLEKENAQLKAQIAVLEKRNHELVLSLFQNRAPLPEQVPQKRDHKIDRKSETLSTCSCGWSFISDDPVNMQYAITEHYRQGVVSPTHTRWAQTRNAAEKVAEEEALKKQEKLQ